MEMPELVDSLELTHIGWSFEDLVGAINNWDEWRERERERERERVRENRANSYILVCPSLQNIYFSVEAV